MEGDFQLPNGHLLNLNPRPRNNSKSNRQPPTTSDSKLPQSRERVPSSGTEGEALTRQSPNAMPQTSLSGLATKLPLPKSFMEKGKCKGKWKDKQPYVEDEVEKDEISKHKPLQESDTTPTISEHTPEKSTEKNHDHHWSKIRGKLDKDSPLLRKSKEKQEEYYQGAYRRIKSFANGPRNETPKNKKYGEANTSDTKLPTLRTTGISSPNNRARSASGGITRAPAIRQPPKQKKQQQQQQQKDEHPAPLQIKKSPSRQPSGITDNTTDSSAYSQLSTSSVSGRASSNTEWEDRFVVNMPSATDPNPPFLTAQQIVEFQKSIEKVRREGGDMVHPDTCPSPRTTTPEGKTDMSEKTSERDNSTTENKKQDKTNANITNPLQPGRYYSPEEIGKKRCSTIWEEDPSKAKQENLDATPDGSFLGCKEIGPEEKNPDEILFFSTMTERPKVVDISAPISRKPRAKTKPTGRRVPGDMDDNIMAYREWRSLSDNLMNGQRSKQASKTMCQEPVCQPQGKVQAPKTSGKENLRNSLAADSRDNLKEDDIFMNTATVSRAPVTASGKTIYKRSPSQLPQFNSRTMGDSTPTSREPMSRSPPSGLRRGIPRPHEKNDGNQNTLSKSPLNTKNISINKTRGKPGGNSDSPRGIRGIMRFPGMGKPSMEQSTSTNKRQSSMPVPMNKSSGAEKRSISGPSLVSSEPSCKSVTPVSYVIPEENNKDPSTEIVDAELDGEAKQRAKDVTTDSPNNVENSGNENTAYPLTLALLFDILILTIAYIQRFSSEFLGNEYPQVILQSIVKMLEHCANVSRHVSLAFLTYRSTGSWPKSGNGDLCDSFTDIAQAAVYLVSLGFMIIIIGRAAGYVVIVGSWVVWMAKPFGWALGLLAKALVP